MNLSRIMIAGTNSGCGKTTVFCAILAAIKSLGCDIQPYKCGPDFIDPSYHSIICGKKSINLDVFLSNQETLKSIVSYYSKNAEISMVEGVMGYYDGISADSFEGSSYHISKIIDTPVILVVNGRGMALSVCAQVNGYLNLFPDNKIKGIIINDVFEDQYKKMKAVIEEKCNIKLYGFLSRNKEIQFTEKQLGLVSAEDYIDANFINRLAEAAKKSIDINAIMDLASSVNELKHNNDNQIKYSNKKKFNLAVAYDKAFCFYYEDNLRLLESNGANLIYFSPINDDTVPSNAHGIYFGGGYFDSNTEQLTSNIKMISSVKSIAGSGIPIYAESTGFVYLLSSLSYENKYYNLCNIIKGHAFKKDRLNNFGYHTLISLNDNILSQKNTNIKSHQFTYYDSDVKFNAFKMMKKSHCKGNALYSENNILAGFPYIYFHSNLNVAANFCNACLTFKKNQEEHQ